GIVHQLMDACVPGSFIAISHPASDIDTEQHTEMVRRLNQSVAEKVALRDRARVTRLFDGLELVEPGVVRAPEWRPGSDIEAARPAGLWGGGARKPSPAGLRGTRRPGGAGGDEPATRRPACQTAVISGTPGR